MIEEEWSNSAKRLPACLALSPHRCFKNFEVFMGLGKVILRNKTCAFLTSFQPSVLFIVSLHGFLVQLSLKFEFNHIKRMTLRKFILCTEYLD